MIPSMVSSRYCMSPESRTPSPVRPRITGPRRRATSGTIRQDPDHKTNPTELLRSIDRVQHARAAASHAFKADQQQRARQQPHPLQRSKTENIPSRRRNSTRQRPRPPPSQRVNVTLPLAQITNRAANGARYAESSTDGCRSDVYGSCDSDYTYAQPVKAIERQKSVLWENERVERSYTEEFTDQDYAEYFKSSYTPPPVSSTPSSYRRIGKVRSSFSLARAFTPGNDYSSAGGSSPRRLGDDDRRSMSFLRGGTDFMPESLKQQYHGRNSLKERRSFYIPGSARNQRPFAFADATLRKPRESQRSQSMTNAVKEKAKKMSESLIGSVKKALGSLGRRQPVYRRETTGELQIPEQHVSAERNHFEPYVPPDETYEDGFVDCPLEPPNYSVPKIKSKYVMSNNPILHTVEPSEMVHSELASIVDINSPGPSHRKASNSTTGTLESGITWDGTITTRVPSSHRLPIIDEREGTIVRRTLQLSSIAPMMDARRVYSALMRRLNETDSPIDFDQEYPESTAGDSTDQQFMTHGLGLTLNDGDQVFPEMPVATVIGEAFSPEEGRDKTETLEDFYRPPTRTPPPPPVACEPQGIGIAIDMPEYGRRSDEFSERSYYDGEKIAASDASTRTIRTVKQYREQAAAHTPFSETEDDPTQPAVMKRARIRRVPRSTIGLLRENQHHTNREISLYRSKSAVDHDYTVLPAESFLRPRASTEEPMKKLRLRKLKSRDMNIPHEPEDQIPWQNQHTQLKKCRSRLSTDSVKDIENAVGQIFGPTDGDSMKTDAYDVDERRCSGDTRGAFL